MVAGGLRAWGLALLLAVLPMTAGTGPVVAEVRTGGMGPVVAEVRTGGMGPVVAEVRTGGTGVDQLLGVPGSVGDQGSALSAALGLREGPRSLRTPSGQTPTPPSSAVVTGRDRGRTALWGWPLAGTPRIVNGFDPPAQRWLPGHRGIDLAGVAGEPVLAVEAGVVGHSGEIAGVGVVSIVHADGLRSTYQPVSDRVRRGERVSRGQTIGTLDVGGHCLLVDCLHLGARRGRDLYVDPTPLLVPLELTLVPPTGAG